MLIQPSIAAGAAAGSVAQAGSKDRASAASSDAASNALTTTVERVARGEGAQADRDAQGGGQGLGSHGSQREAEAHSEGQEPSGGLLARAPEPPSQLDIIG